MPESRRPTAEADRLEAERRREFRRFVLTTHPDRGGDPEQFRTGLARFRRRALAQASPAPAVVAHRKPTLRRSIVSTVRRLTRRTPSSPPRVR